MLTLLTVYLYLKGYRKEDHVRLQKYCICAEADYLSQKLMKCETNDAIYSLQPLQMTKYFGEIKVLVTLNIQKNTLVFQSQQILW